MKTVFSWLIQILVVAVFGYGVFIFLTGNNDETTPLVDQPAITEAVLNLPVAHLLPRVITPEYVSLAKVEALRTSNLSSQATGRVVWVCDCFEEGRQVVAGERLLVLDDAGYRRDVVDREKDLGNAQAALVVAELETEQARESHARLDLGEPNDIVLKIPELTAAGLAVTSAQSALEIARNALEETKIVAPYNGIITSVAANVGDLIGAGAVLGALVDTDHFRVRFPILENQLSLVRIGAEINVATTTNPVIQKTGVIEAIDIDIDQTTRLNSVIVSIAAPLEGDILRLGRFVNGSFTGETQENLFAIPLISLNNEEQFFIIDDDGRLALQTSLPLYRDFQAIYIDAGTRTELTIVTGNVLGLREGIAASGYVQ